ncbi:hypothetical protein [Actinacidiphila sp. bgisy145]|uniref:hypothetical protein n=1 Tax=Actinacidiphila sp. bgisy145 TaxID=3413792 RepID=UPI003EBDF2F2
MHINHTVTLGGVAVGSACVVAQAIYWWFREHHKAAALMPFILSAAYGMLITLSGGGILGWAAGTTLWSANLVGDHSLRWGVGGTTMDVTRARELVLDPGGHVVVLLITVVLVCLWKFAKKLRSWKLAVGLVAGICLALSGTVAGAAAVPLGSSVNSLGSVFTVAMAV